MIWFAVRHEYFNSIVVIVESTVAVLSFSQVCGKCREIPKFP